MAGPSRFILALYTNLTGHDNSNNSLHEVASVLFGHLASILDPGPEVAWGRLSPDGPAWIGDSEEALAANLSTGGKNARGESIHALLDQLPRGLGFLLDVLWLVPKFPTFEEIPPEIYCALKRAHSWHGAQVTMLPMEDEVRVATNDILTDLRAETLLFREAAASATAIGEFLDPGLVWRGSLSLYDGDGHCYRDLPGFELVADNRDHKLGGGGGEGDLELGLRSPPRVASPQGRKRRTRKAPRLSHRLKVLSCCDRRRIPEAALTDREFSVRTSLFEGDDCAEAMLGDPAFFSPTQCLLAKVDRWEPDPTVVASSSAGRSYSDWKRSVGDGVIERERDEDVVDMANSEEESLYFVIYEDCHLQNRAEYRNMLEKTAILLNPSALSTPGCLGGRRTDPPIFQVDKERKDALVRRFFAQDDAVPAPEWPVEEEADWAERRLLADVDQFRRALEREAAARKGSSSEEFVVLEAKELLKFFDGNGDAKSPERLEPLRPRRTPLIVEKEEVAEAPWPDILCLEHPGLHFNRGDASEELDRRCQRSHKMHVGLTRETASTCIRTHAVSVDTAAAIRPAKTKAIVSKSAKQQPQCTSETPSKRRTSSRRRPLAALAQQTREHSEKTKSSPRASSTTSKGGHRRQQQKPMTKEEVFLRKVRNAVYEALVAEGVGEDHRLFKPCFRQLFNVCKVFGEAGTNAGGGAAAGGGTKKFLAEVARSNAKLAIIKEKQSCQRGFMENTGAKSEVSHSSRRRRK